MSACCLACSKTGGSCGGLGDYPALPGHAIPYALTPQEISDLFVQHGGDAVLDQYLQTRVPAWGIVIHEAYGEFLVWFDASGRLTVTDVTNMSISREVQKAAYVSPEPGILERIQEALSGTQTALAGAGVLAGVVALAYVLYRTAK